ncbi:hypothetical protein ES708_35217 [subsurface metagenome]
MNLRLDFKGYRFYIALTHSGQVKGVNSKLPSGNHFLMWDFDDKEGKDVREALLSIQKRFKLPRIYLLNTGLDGFYHAYCFKAHSWPDTLKIVASTECLDQVFFKIGAIRGYFTLRYTPKGKRAFQPAVILPSRYKEDVNPYGLTSFVKYWTKRL